MFFSCRAGTLQPIQIRQKPKRQQQNVYRSGKNLFQPHAFICFSRLMRIQSRGFNLIQSRRFNLLLRSWLPTGRY